MPAPEVLTTQRRLVFQNKVEKGNLAMAYEIKRFPYDGTIDADGHILEPPDLWENYLEDKYKKRALRIGVDDEGYEYLEIDQNPSRRSRRGYLCLLVAMGEEAISPSTERRDSATGPFGCRAAT